MTKMLSKQYQSVLTTPTTRKTNNPTPEHEFLNDIEIKEKSMKEAIQSISTWSAVGPDEVT